MVVYKYVAAGTTISDETHNDVGTGAFALDKGAFLGGGNLTIRTEPAGGGTLLTENTDYTLGSTDSELTAKVGSSVYTTVTVSNGAYQATDLYVTYKVVASYNNLLADYANATMDQYRQNDLINGGCEFWQRGTSFAAVATGAYTMDRYEYAKSGAMVHTISRESTIIPSNKVNYSMKVDCTTIDAAIAASDYCQIQQKIEGYNFRKYLGVGYGTLSYWVYSSNKTGVMCVSFRNSNGDRSYVVETEIFNTGVWEQKIITVPMDYSGGTWDYTNNTGLSIAWALAAGTDWQTTAEAWQTSSELATANQDNFVDSTSNVLYFSQMKFEPGQVATPFIPADFNLEFQRCQRYYEKTYDLGTTPGTITTNGMLEVSIANLNNSDHTFYTDWRYKVTKRNNSNTLTFYSAVSGTSGKIRMASGDVNSTVSTQGESGCSVFGTNGAASTTRAINFHATCDSEL